MAGPATSAHGSTARLPLAAGGATPSETPSPSARTIWVDLLLYPTHSLPTALAPVLVGVGLAIHDDVLAPLPALIAFLGSWLIHVAGVFTDNHELLRKHPELPEHPELTQAVRAGTLKLSTLRGAVAACLLLALLTAPYLFRIGGWPVLAFGALGIAVSLSYNGGPWAYVRRGLADPIFFVMFAFVGVAGTWFIQAAATHGATAPAELLAAVPLPVLLTGIPSGALVTAVMLIDDLRDHEFDAAKGWRTGAVVHGPGWNRTEITLLVALAYAAPVAFWLTLGFDAWVLLPLASAPLAWSIARVVRTERERTRLIPMTPKMARLALLHSLLLAVGIALSS
jgi:1,4-dihydroxy-2-naphthoate octaprenyltransferase